MNVVFVVVRVWPGLKVRDVFFWLCVCEMRGEMGDEEMRRYEE